jgi:uncharacterized protein with ParB-like and HNH nuclease domain
MTMSNINTGSITIFETLQNIKNEKYVMPAFQRQFVWSMDQIEKLWDSILLDYPIATFLFWHIDDNNVTWDTYFCDFLHKVIFDSRKQSDSTNYDLKRVNLKYTDTAILDGQQRMTSLFLSLLGEAQIRPKNARKKSGSVAFTKLLIELNKNKLTVDEEEYNSKRFDIKFTEKILRISPTQFDIKQILEQKFQDVSTRQQAIENAVINVPHDSKEYAREILNKLCKKVFDEKLIHYTEISDMKQDDALEMFVRFNSGGKALRKSEITMSILEAYWSSAKTEFGHILTDSYEKFGSDFIIRSALMLFGDVVKSNINKNIADELKNNWGDFKQALNKLETVLKGMKIEISRFSGSWNVLLPILYSIYYNPDYNQTLDGIKAYLLRAILFNYFQSGTTGKLQQMKSNIINYDYEITIEMLDQMNELRVSDGKIDDIINAEEGSRLAGEALHYLSRDWLSTSFKYEQDHLHPKERFENKPISVSMVDWKRWCSNRNRLPNLHLLEGRSNGSKNDMRLVDYYNDMNDEQKKIFLERAFIPEDVSLEIEDFGDFYERRREILTEKIKALVNG